MAPHRSSAVLAGALFPFVAALVAGCGRSPEPQFTPTEATLELMPEIRDGMTAPDDDGGEVHLDGMKQVLAERFGTPSRPVVWPLLPIDFGGTPAAVSKVVAPTEEAAEQAESEEKPLERVTVAVTTESSRSLGAVGPGAQVGWTDGTYKGRLSKVVSFDRQSNELTLAGTFDDGLPDVGDEVLVAPGATLAKGQALYARHCLHCHGPGGAGDGPTARYLTPKPRDYRHGKFKFTSTATSEKASRTDLMEILKQGVPGTSMPAFRLLSDEELHALVEYVLWLTMRGEYEVSLAATAAGAYDLTRESYAERIADGDDREEILEEVRDFLENDLADIGLGEDLADAWQSANDESALVVPNSPRVADTPESRARGRALYLSDKAKCATCHGPYAKGDGPQAETIQKNPYTNEPYPLPGLYDDWGNPLPPRDLTQGIFRGGRRPIDLFRRVHAGIKGTPMPAFGGSLTEDEIWDIVNYVLHAPYDALPKPGTGKALVSAGH